MSSSTAAILALVIILLPPITLAGDLHGFRATLTRIHELSPANTRKRYAATATASLFLSDATAAGKATTTNSSVSFQALLENGVGGYNMNISVGTPLLTFSVVADTGSDLIWTQCAPCTKCFQQPAPPFQPASSSTFSKLPCTSSFCQFLPNSIRTCNATGCVYNYSTAAATPRATSPPRRSKSGTPLSPASRSGAARRTAWATRRRASRVLAAARCPSYRSSASAGSRTASAPALPPAPARYCSAPWPILRTEMSSRRRSSTTPRYTPRTTTSTSPASPSVRRTSR
ncbi:hypothetical protein EE612_039728 [Oryza sativa]|nr:hypothetical protein EE612_039728 [Oryza sativa]